MTLHTQNPTDMIRCCLCGKKLKAVSALIEHKLPGGKRVLRRAHLKCLGLSK